MDTRTTIVDSGDSIEVTIHLDAINELFTAPELDPFKVQAWTTSGIEDLVAHLDARRLRHKPTVKMMIALPPSALRLIWRKKYGSPDSLLRSRDGNRRAGSMATSRFEGFDKLPIGDIRGCGCCPVCAGHFSNSA